MKGESERRLVRRLQRAYSGELAAALAYRGHARSVREPERGEIFHIEEQELDHRRRVGAMLAVLGASPDPRIEARLRRVGRILGAACRVAGWFLPMYAAGRLESRNVGEYEDAAREAVASGREEFRDTILEMAEVEREHERYFRSKAASHPLWRVAPKWPVPAVSGA